MRRYLRIINIDGTEGSGKTTQIKMISDYFKTIGVPCKVNYLDDNIESGIAACQETMKFLQENEYGVVINDGSPARMIVTDLVFGMQNLQVLEKYKELLQIQEVANHKYGTANLLLVMEDVDEAHRRLLRKGQLFGVDTYGIQDLQKETDVVNAMKKFDVHPASKGLKFDVINVGPKEPILDVSLKIKEFIDKNFEIKKP